MTTKIIKELFSAGWLVLFSTFGSNCIDMYKNKVTIDRVESNYRARQYTHICQYNNYTSDLCMFYQVAASDGASRRPE